MNVLSPRLPPGVREMFNALYPTREPRYLTDDLYAAELPHGIFVSVGWFPELDPSGAYEVCFYRGRFEDQICPPFGTHDLDTVIRIIEGFAAALTGSAYPFTITASGSQATSSPEEGMRATTASNSQRLALVG